MKYIAVSDFLSEFPEYHELYANQEWHVENVGHAYYYDESVSYYNLYAFHGVFMDLFIRKCFCKKLNIPCQDDRTEKILRENKFRNNYIHNQVVKAYNAYINSRSQAINIIDDIKLVALSQRLTHGEDMEDFSEILSMDVDINNLKDVMMFVNKTTYTHMIFKEPCDLYVNDYILRGVPDFIFDDKIFCQITTSMYKQPPIDKLAQVVLYILGHYGRYSYRYGAVKNFTIQMYNPLLGLTYTTNFRLTPREFERMVESIEILTC